MSAPEMNIATIVFASPDEAPFELGHVEVNSEESWPSLIRQLCRLAGAGSRDPARVTLRLRAPEKGPTHRGLVFPGNNLMMYISRCVKEGKFGTGFTSTAVLEAVESQQNSAEEDYADQKQGNRGKVKNDTEESDYLKIRPQAMFWTPAILKSYMALPAKARAEAKPDIGDPSELEGWYMIDKHRKHMAQACAKVRWPAR